MPTPLQGRRHEVTDYLRHFQTQFLVVCVLFRIFKPMAKNKLPWILGAGALLFFVLQRKKQIARTAQFSFDKLGLNLKQGGLNVTLGVLNPAAGSITINSVVGFLKVNGVDVATVQNFTRTTVAGNAKTPLQLLLKPSGTGIFQTVKKIIAAKKAGNKQAFKVTFVGNSNIDGMTLPISTQLV